MHNISVFIVALLIIMTNFTFSQVITILKPDLSKNTYDNIEDVLGVNAGSESPDFCNDPGHPDYGPHIKQEWDDELKKHVFVFALHLNYDLDRCDESKNRQRNEIKIHPSAKEELKGEIGETVIYKWMFKLDKNFKASKIFTHLHQLKADNKANSKLPLITLTPRNESMELIYSPDNIEKKWIKKVSLKDFIGEWVEVEEKVFFGENGSYVIKIKRKKDQKILMSYNYESINMWSKNASAIRPKWGIYRDIKSDVLKDLKDENIKFAYFSIEEHEDLDVCDVPEHYEGFENELQSSIWKLGGEDALIRRDHKFKGRFAGLIRDNSGNKSSIYTSNLDFSGVPYAKLLFAFYVKNMRQNEHFLLEISLDGGKTFSVIKKWIHGDDFQNNKWYQEKVIVNLSSTNLAFNNKTRLRFRCNGFNDGDKVFLDDISLFKCAGKYNSTQPIKKKKGPQNNHVVLIKESTSELLKVNVFPNPVSNMLTISTNSDVQKATLHDISGKVLGSFNIRQNKKIDMSPMDPGIYLLKIHFSNTMITKRIIRQ